MVLLIRDYCESVVDIPWFAGAILCVVLALSALGILDLPDPSVLLVFILGSISCEFIGSDVRELLIVVLGVQLIILRVTKGGHADLTIRRVVSHTAVLE
jgi:hypothetical protein